MSCRAMEMAGPVALATLIVLATYLTAVITCSFYYWAADRRKCLTLIEI